MVARSCGQRNDGVMDTTEQMLALGKLMNRPITITRGKDVVTGTLASLTVSYLHSSGPHVSLSIEGFARMSITLQPGDLVDLV